MASFDAIASSPLFIAGLALGALGLLALVAALAALLRGRPLAGVIGTLAGVALAALGALATTIAIGVQGYAALTGETVAATISVSPSGAQRFDARVRFADRREASFVIAGDELYVDAHVLKWKPIANVLGLHTAYELDRIGGRYHSVEQERTALRTVHPLGVPSAIDFFRLRSRYAWLAPLVDAEYGSATFVPVSAPMELEVRVSTSGLLIREAAHP